MNVGLMPACRLLALGGEDALGIVCRVLALLLLTGIALGFGPLHTWIGLRRAHVPSGLSTSEESSLLATWRLYRQLGRDHPAAAGFSVPDVPAWVVLAAMEGSALGGQPTPDLTGRLWRMS